MMQTRCRFLYMFNISASVNAADTALLLQSTSHRNKSCIWKVRPKSTYTPGHHWIIKGRTSLFIIRLLCRLSLWSLTYEIHKLVKFRSNDNLCTTVALLTQLGIVSSNRIVLTTATSGQTLRINTETVLQRQERSQLLRIFFILSFAVLIGTLSVLPSISTS